MSQNCPETFCRVSASISNFFFHSHKLLRTIYQHKMCTNKIYNVSSTVFPFVLMLKWPFSNYDVTPTMLVFLSVFQCSLTEKKLSSIGVIQLLSKQYLHIIVTFL